MALSTISNGESGSSVRTSLNAAINAIREKTDSSISYASTITTSASSVGTDATIRISLTGDITINAPSGGSDGQRIRYILTASGSTRSIAISGLTTPVDSTFVSSIPSGYVRMIEIEKKGSAWLVSKNLQFSA